MITANVEAGMDRKQAVEKAVDEAIKEKLLGVFFKINRAEVIGMCMTEFDEELAIHTWREDGRVEGCAEKAVEVALNALSMKLTTEQISKMTGLPLEKVLELQKTIPAEANA